MCPPPPLPVLLRQLLPAIILLSLCRSVRTDTDIIYGCPIQCGTYASNLEDLLDDIYSSTPFTSYTTSYGAGAGKVFGTARCDYSTTCQDCIQIAIDTLTSRCSGNLVGGALVVENGCKVQYANCDTCYIPVELPANYNGTWPPPGYVPPPLPSNCLGSESPPPQDYPSPPPPSPPPPPEPTDYPPPSPDYQPPIPADYPPPTPTDYPPPPPDHPPPIPADYPPPPSHFPPPRPSHYPPPELDSPSLLDPSPPLRQQLWSPPPPPPPGGAGGGGGAGDGSTEKKSDSKKMAYILPPVIAAPLVLGAILTMFLLNKAPVPTGASQQVNQNAQGNVNAGDPQQFPGQWSTDNAGPAAQTGSDNAAAGTYSADGWTGSEGYSGGFDSNASYTNAPPNPSMENTVGNVYAGNHQQFQAQWSPVINDTAAPGATYSASGGMGAEGYSGFNSDAVYWNAPAMAIPAAGFVGERAVRNTPISEHPVGAERPRSGEGGQGGAVYDQGSSAGTDEGGRCCPVIVPLGSRSKPHRRGREESP